jgi:hypothetical protein
VTLFDFHPVVLLVGVLGMAILWRVRSLVAARVAARRFATVAMGFLAILLVISLSVRFIDPGPQTASWRLLKWKLDSGAFGSSTAATLQTTVVSIEVDHPPCVANDSGPWIADPVIFSTPWAVTITMHMKDTADTATCGPPRAPYRGSLPLVGGYLTGIFYEVHLGEPLGGRALFDGSSFPPAEQSLP